MSFKNSKYMAVFETPGDYIPSSLGRNAGRIIAWMEES